jgi:hypothetical protein
MARPVRFNPKLTDIIDIISKFEGNLAQVSKHYGVCRETVYSYIGRTRELKEKIEEIRATKNETDLDSAENVMRYFLSAEQVKDNPKIAQDTAKYVLDKKGHTRGWGDGGQTSSQEKVKAHLQDISDWTDEAYKQIKGKNE